jgi:hypothetical protein
MHYCLAAPLSRMQAEVILMELQLKRGGELLGSLRAYDIDSPWIICKFEPTESFQAVKPLFEEELKLLNTDDMEAWETAYARIGGLGLRLVDVEKREETSEFILHIEGDEAWFRS